LEAKTIFACTSTYTLRAENVAAASYQWFKDGLYLATTATPTYTATQNGIYRVAVVANGCDAVSDWTEVNLNFKPKAKILQGTYASFCKTGVISAKNVTGASYTWLNGSTIVGTSKDLTVTASGTYQLVVNQFGCDSKPVSIAVNVNAFPATIDLNATKTSFCPNEFSVISTNLVDGVSYEWYRNGRLFANTTTNSVKVKQSGDYSVKMIYDVNCTATSAAITITRFDAPIVYLFNDGKLRLEIVSGASVASIKWFIDDVEEPSLLGKTEVTPTKAGNYSAMVTYTNGCSINTGTSLIMLGIEGEETTDKGKIFTIYPNPTKDVLNIQLTKATDANVYLIDALGRLVMERNVSAATGETLLTLDLKALATGIYTLKFTQNGQSTFHKLIRE